MARVKRQHYVPRGYLKRFTFDGGRLHVLDKAKRQVRVARTEEVASENGFYDLPPEVAGDGRDPQVVEKAFHRLENAVPGVIADVVAGAALTTERRVVLAQFVAVQSLRTPAFRTFAVQLYEQVAQRGLEVAARATGRPGPPGLVRVRPRDAPAYHARLLADARRLQTMTRVLLDHIWTVQINEAGQPLYTSDAPVILLPHVPVPRVPERHRWSAGIASPGVQVVLPLDGKHALVLSERSYWSVLAPLDGASFPVPAGAVFLFNFVQVWESQRQVYCDADSFEHALRVCEEHPDICDPGRQRAELL